MTKPVWQFSLRKLLLVATFVAVHTGVAARFPREFATFFAFLSPVLTASVISRIISGIPRLLRPLMLASGGLAMVAAAYALMHASNTNDLSDGGLYLLLAMLSGFSIACFYLAIRLRPNSEHLQPSSESTDAPKAHVDGQQRLTNS